MAELSGVESYNRDGDAMGMILKFTVEHDDETHEIPFFAPAKLSISEENDSSRLGENLNRVGLLEPVCEMLNCWEAIQTMEKKWYAADENEFNDLETAIRATLSGKQVRIDVGDNQDGDASQVSKLSKVFGEEE